MIGGEIDSYFYYGAQGGKHAAGIGCGNAGTCGTVTVAPELYDTSENASPDYRLIRPATPEDDD